MLIKLCGYLFFFLQNEAYYYQVLIQDADDTSDVGEIFSIHPINEQNFIAMNKYLNVFVKHTYSFEFSLFDFCHDFLKVLDDVFDSNSFLKPTLCFC